MGLGFYLFAALFTSVSGFAEPPVVDFRQINPNEPAARAETDGALRHMLPELAYLLPDELLRQLMPTESVLDAAGYGDCFGNRPPVAVIDYTVEDGRTVLFDARSSYDRPGFGNMKPGIKTVEWDFGDGSTASGWQVHHTYADDGEYTVTLTVTDMCNAATTATEELTFEPEGLQACFKVYQLVRSYPDRPEEEWDWHRIDIAGGEEIEYGAELRFDVSCSTGNIDFINLSFGDGYYSNEPVSYHQYNSEGPYYVELTLYCYSPFEMATCSAIVNFDSGMDYLRTMAYPGEDFWPRCIARNGQDVWAVSMSGALGHFDVSTTDPLPNLDIELTGGSIAYGNSIAATSSYLIVEMSDLGLEVHSRDNPGNPAVLLPEDLGGRGSRCVAAHGDFVYVLLEDGSVRVYDATTGFEEHENEFQIPGGAFQIAVSPTHGLVSISVAGYINVFSLEPSPAAPMQVGSTLWLSSPITGENLEVSDNVACVRTDAGVTLVWLDEFGASDDPTVWVLDQDSIHYTLSDSRLYLMNLSGGRIYKYSIADRLNGPYLMDSTASLVCNPRTPFVHDPDGPGGQPKVLIVGHTAQGFSKYKP